MPKTKDSPAAKATTLYISYTSIDDRNRIRSLSELFHFNGNTIVFRGSSALRNAVITKFKTSFTRDVNIINELGFEYARLIVSNQENSLFMRHLRLINDGKDPIVNEIYIDTLVKVEILEDSLKKLKTRLDIEGILPVSRG
jgi:hypothetical protein